MKMIHAFAGLILNRLISSLLLKNGPVSIRRCGVKRQNVTGTESGICT